MSNEPIRNVTSDAHDGHASGPSGASAHADLTADAELVLAAIRRIETKLFDDYAQPPMQRLGRQIAELAADVAEARLSFELDQEYGARATDMEALLKRLEGRVAAMQAIAGHARIETDGRGAATMSPEAAVGETVPTVRQVVSLLDQTVEWGAMEATPFEPPAGRPPSLAKLEAMVEALTTSAPFAPPSENEDRPVVETEKVETGAPANEVTRLEPATGQAEAGTDAEAMAENRGEADRVEVAMLAEETPAAPVPPSADENDLLSDFARMEAMPYLPQEIGTAVIFASRASALDVPMRMDGAIQAQRQDAQGQDQATGDASQLDTMPAQALHLTGPMSAEPASLGEHPLRFQWPAQTPSPNNAAPEARNSPPGGDPLAPLKRLSSAEMLALFS